MTQRTGYIPGGGFRAIVAANGPAIAAMVGFDGWTESAAHMHVAVDRPGACRGLLRAAFRYLFEQCGRVLARGEVRASNHRSRTLALHLGFRPVGRVTDGWAVGEDLVQFEMRRHECRWIGAHHG